jgi:FKBP-type peptidyl-prolyl cis-trans isomerase (trigger factor)
MPESEPEIPAFSVTASETSPVARSLSIDVEQGSVTDAFEKAYKALGKSVRLKGFRPGKAPRSAPPSPPSPAATPGRSWPPPSRAV